MINSSNDARPMPRVTSEQIKATRAKVTEIMGRDVEIKAAMEAAARMQTEMAVCYERARMGRRRDVPRLRRLALEVIKAMRQVRGFTLDAKRQIDEQLK